MVKALGVWDIEAFEYREAAQIGVEVKLGLDLINLENFDFKLPEPPRDGRHYASRFMGGGSHLREDFSPDPNDNLLCDQSQRDYVNFTEELQPTEGNQR